MTWEPVTRLQSRPAANEPQIRIAGACEVSISLAALDLLGNPARLVLEIDAAARLLSLRAAGPEDGEAFSPTGKGAVRRFSTVALSRRHGLSASRQVFRPRLEDGRLTFGPYELAAPSREAVRQMVATAVRR